MFDLMTSSQPLCEQSSTLHSLHASYFGTETTGTINDCRLDLSKSMSEVDQQESGSPRRRGFRLSADTTFETTVMNTLLAGGLADVWQVSSVGHLVALAGQACKEVCMAADAYPTQPDSRFTERLRSTHVSDLSIQCSCITKTVKNLHTTCALFQLMHRDIANFFCLSSDMCYTAHLLYLWLCGHKHYNLVLYGLDHLSLPLGADFIPGQPGIILGFSSN